MFLDSNILIFDSRTHIDGYGFESHSRRPTRGVEEFY